MSIHTLKVKSNRFQNKISGGIGNPNGFSLVGGHRNLPYVGQTNLSKSVTRTRFRGNYPMGNGGNNGKYKISIANSGSCCFNDPNIIKKSVGNSSYAIIHKNKWLHSSYPRLITKSVDNVINQSDYIKKLSINNSKCTANVNRGMQYFVYHGIFPLVDAPTQNKQALDNFMLTAPLLASGVSLNFSNLSTCTNSNFDTGMDNFSVYMRGYFRPQITGAYKFSARSDDAVALYVDGVLNINDVGQGAQHDDSFLITGNDIQMIAGNYYLIEIYYREITGNQNLAFGYTEPNGLAPIYDTTNLYSYFQQLPQTDNVIKGNLNCDNMENGDRCKQRSHYIGGKKYVSSLYFKKNNKYAIPSSEYQSNELMKKRDLPTPDCKKPFPFVMPNNNKSTNLGSKHIWFKTPQQAIQSGYLPIDWMNCNIYNNSECLYGIYKYS